MATVTGVVTKVYENDVKTRFGAKKSYKVLVDGVGYSAGFTNPSLNPGDMVELDHKGDAYNTVIGTIRKAGPAATSYSSSFPTPTPTNPAPLRAGAIPTSNRPFPIPPLHGDRAIIRQNALGHATRLAVCFYELNKGIPKGVDVASDVIALARKLEAYSCGDLDREAAEADIAGKAEPSE